MTDGNLLVAVRGEHLAGTGEWLAQGLSRRQFQALVDAGRLVRVRFGVYATESLLTKARRDPRLRHGVTVAAAQVATGRDSVASHESAALIHDVALFRAPPAGQVTLTRLPGARKGRPSAGGVVFHAAALPAGQVTSYHGVPLTTAARTVADLARTASFMAGVVSADGALHEAKVTKAELAEVLATCAKWPGVEQARKVAAFSDQRAESPLESCARVVFAQHGLPTPDLQVELGGDRFVGRVDFYWPEYATVAEADGALKYVNRNRAVDQLERDQELRAAGFRAVHFTWNQLFKEQLRVIGWIKSAFRGEIGLVAGPGWRALFGEGGVELGVVGGCHQQGLGLGVQFHRRGQGHVLLAGEQRLGLRVGLSGAGGQPLGEVADRAVQGVRGYQFGDQADAVGFVGFCRDRLPAAELWS